MPLRFAPVWGLILLLFAGCAGLAPREPVHVNVVGIEPLPGEGLEARFAVRLRVQNPNDAPIHYDGIFVELELAGRDFGSGVSAAAGEIPRFGEAIVEVPVTVPFSAVVRQLFGLASHQGAPGPVSYRLRGRLGGVGPGGVRFDKQGELRLDAAPR